jgi:hypothetical protein
MRYQWPGPVITSRSRVLPPMPGDGEAGAVDRARHDRFWGGECLALHPGASHGRTRAWGRWLIPGGITSTLADPRERTRVWTTKPRGLTGAVPAIAHNDAWARWKPAHHAGHEESGQLGRHCRARAMGRIPGGVARPGAQHRERPGPDRKRPLDQSRHDDPLVPPPIGRITVGRAHPVTMASLAEDVGAWPFCHRVIARQQHRARRDAMVQETRAQQAGQHPG